jgi:hypothetical protein
MITDEKARAWLMACCAKDRSFLSTPFGVTMRGERMVCAASGYVLLLLPGEEPVRADAPSLTALEPELFDADGGRLARLDDLRAWCRDGLPPPLQPSDPCPDCNGAGKIKCDACGGSGSCSCYRCDAEHESGQCDGDGKVKCDACKGESTAGANREPPPHDGLLADRVLVARSTMLNLIGDAPGEVVQVKARGPLDGITFHGDGWKGLLMPKRPPTGDAAPHSRFTGWQAR